MDGDGEGRLPGVARVVGRTARHGRLPDGESGARRWRARHGQAPVNASDAEAEKLTAVVGPVALTLVGPGTVTTGGVVSRKLRVTLKLAEP